MRLFKKGVLGAAIIAGCSACTDTIDEHYGVADSVVKQNLWEQIVAQPELSDFAQLLSQTKFYEREGKSSDLTYKDILQQNSKFTVWAPVNGSFNLQEKLDQLNNGEAYQVDYTFVRNHINMFSKSVSGADNDSITMLNTKMHVLNKVDSTFRGIDVAESNIAASNGMLHVLSGPVPFIQNLYEFMGVEAGVDSLYQYFKSGEEISVDENNSIYGGIVDGEVSIVDTVWIEANNYFSYSFTVDGNTGYGINANLKNEDSTYVMIMPTNAAWNAAVAKTKKYYTYMADKYADRSNLNDASAGNIINPDSMQNVQTKMSIVNRLVFSTNTQKDYTFEDFGNTDSLFTTRNEVIKAPYCNQIFDGKKPVSLSNGYAYIVDNYNYNIMNDIQFEGESGQFYKTNSTTSTSVANVVNANRNPKVTGSVSGNMYMYTTSSTGDACNLIYKIPDVLSGTYDIYAVIVPENIQDTSSLRVTLPLKFEATINYNVAGSSRESTAKSGDKTSNINKVDTILLFENFQFPIAYKGVPNASPLITLDVTAGPRELGKTCTNSICLDQIILKAKED